MSDRFGGNGYVAILPGVELVAPVLPQPEFLIECGRAGVASAPISEMETSTSPRRYPNSAPITASPSSASRQVRVDSTLAPDYNLSDLPG